MPFETEFEPAPDQYGYQGGSSTPDDTVVPEFKARSAASRGQLRAKEATFYKDGLDFGSFGNIYSKKEAHFALPLPNYKGALFPSVDVELTPADSELIESRYQQLLSGKGETAPDQRRKLGHLAAAAIYLDKYATALSKQEMSIAKVLPEQLRGAFLCSQALQDGATLGSAKAVLHAVIDGGALGDIASGTTMGLAFGKIVATLASNLNPWVRGAALLLQAGGASLALQQIGTIGKECISGWKNSAPALEYLFSHPSETSLVSARQKVANELGPVLADSALVAVGFAAAHGIEKSAGKIRFDGAKKTSANNEIEGIKPRTNDTEVRLAGTTFKIHDGPWKAINERPCVDVVKQIHPDSCISACVDMITGGKLKQADVMAIIGKPADVAYLPRLIGKEWRAGGIGDEELGMLLRGSSPFMAELKIPTSIKAHEVVIDGLNAEGRLTVRDPSEGTKYEMTMAEFKKFWCGRVAFQVRQR